MFDKKNSFETYPQSVRTAFNELEVVLPVVKRVHGGAHPELEEVGRLVGDLKTGLSEGADRGELSGILDRLRKVTVADVQRVARTYLSRDNVTVGRYLATG